MTSVINLPTVVAQEVDKEVVEQRAADSAIEDYFQGDTEDSLGDLLRKSRESEPSASDQPGDDSAAGQSNQEDQDRADSSDDLSSDDGSFDEDDSSQDEEQSQADEDRKARIARQRAMVRHLQKLQKPVHQIQITGTDAPADEVPENRAAFVIGHQYPRTIASSNAQPDIADRSPVAFCHRPLYFEEIDLERCGQHRGVFQNLYSAKYFLLNTIVLPYRLCTQSPSEMVSTRGDCRTGHAFGDDIEPLVDGGRDSAGLATQAAALAGFSFLLL